MIKEARTHLLSCLHLNPDPRASPRPLQPLEPFYDKFDPEFVQLRTIFREVLQKEDELNEIVQLVGKDALAETDKIVLETAR